MRRSKKPVFDPVASLGELITGLERVTGLRADPEPRHIIERIDAAVAEFKRGVLKLHATGKERAAIEDLLEYVERASRRAARLGDEFGTSTSTEVPHGRGQSA
ncbi:hypothetical protein DyAD56_16280 [Dyella sp. AD56]|uniref:hypothetical protein n=1 Tax=Dyella sp. AD56 TaxID=1528744 RepID=UPI000C83EE4F|nr:hypothetical protein [Dyella sp. AD56]PMQ04246.1 hypothetical protein DyAD56_16280 [Dyella sp. AD56]